MMLGVKPLFNPGQMKLFGAMTGNKMIRSDFTQLGRFYAASLLGVLTPGMEITATGWIGRAGNFARQVLDDMAPGGIGDWHCHH